MNILATSLGGLDLLASAVLILDAEGRIAYANAAAVARRLGPTGMLIAAKLAAFVLLCIGAQIMLTGVLDALKPLLAMR